MWKKRSGTFELSEMEAAESTSNGEGTSMETKTTRAQATIGASISIKGEITGGEDLVIHGKVEGQIRVPDHTVIIGKEGNISADVFGNVVLVEGMLTGDIHGAEQVVVKRTGQVRGNVTAPRVTLEDGAKFKGTIDMDPGLDAAQNRNINSWSPSSWSGSGSSDEADETEKEQDSSSFSPTAQ